MRFIRRRKERLFTFQEKSFVTCTFQAQKFRSDGTITYQGPVFSNLVLDVGLDELASRPYSVSDAGAGGVMSYVNVGDDNTDPSTSQSGLQSFVASTKERYGDESTGYDLSDPVHKWLEQTFEFEIGSCTGNLTEVGLSGKSNDDYFNRQLFRDDNGDPTTITVKDDEGLRITARGYLYGDIQPGDTENSSFTLTTDEGDETIDVTREVTDEFWKEVTEYGMVAFNAPPPIRISEDDSGFTGGSEPDSISQKSYSSGDYYRDYEAKWKAGDFTGDIKSIRFPCNYAQSDAGGYSAGLSAFRLDPVIPIKDTEEFTVTLRRSWARYAS